MPLTTDTQNAPAPPPIRLRYLMVLLIPVYRAADGARWIDHLWHKDLVEHVEYIDDFTLACPCIEGPPPATAVRVSDQRIKFADLPGRHKLTLNLGRTVARLWRLVGNTDLVHTGLGGWLPISIPNMTAVMARLRRRFLFIMVESSPWRIVPGSRPSIAERIKAAIAEWTNRRRIDQVDLAIFTQVEYMNDLMRRNRERGHVIHASWIDGDIIAKEQQALDSWGSKLGDANAHLRVLFAGRLTAAKGLLVLLEALKTLDGRGATIELHVMGEGDLAQTCRDCAASLRNVRMKLLSPVPYGPEFFSILGQYHAVVVPSVTDEQPRIVYDAYSQAVPVLASDTAGLRDCIQDGVTGRLVRANDVDALADVLDWSAQNLPRLREMGIRSLGRARSMTHQEMHRQRRVILDQALQHLQRG